MRLLVVSVIAVFAGFLLQQSLRPTVEQLEFDATAAWNAGDAKLAELLARRVLARDTQSDRAFDVLTQVAMHEARPELQIAVAQAQRRPGTSAAAGLIQAGHLAFSYNMIRLAELYWSQALTDSVLALQAHQRLTTVFGLRLDPETMQQRLVA